MVGMALAYEGAEMSGLEGWQIIRTASGNYVANNETLGLTVQSATYAELMEDIDDTLELRILDLAEDEE